MDRNWRESASGPISERTSNSGGEGEWREKRAGKLVPEKEAEKLINRTRQAATTDEVERAVRDFLLDGYSGMQVMEHLLSVLSRDSSLPDLAKAKIATLFSQVDERLVQGCDEEMQLVYLFSHMRPLLQMKA